MTVSSHAPILIGLGANLPSPAGPPTATLAAAIDRLADAAIITLQRSRWFETAPLPASDQPWFVNGVIRVATALEPAALLAAMQRVEAALGRVRGAANAARSLDLDLLAYGERVVSQPPGLILPHPRLAARAFVLLPLADVAPAWHHPVTGRTLAELIGALDGAQVARPLE